MKKDITIENKYDSIYNESMEYYNHLKKQNEFTVKAMVPAIMDKMANLRNNLYLIFN